MRHSHQDGLAAKARTAAATDDHQQRLRTTTDALWQLNGYAFLTCDCGTQIKAPPAYKRQTIGCPHCGRPHLVEG